MYVEPHPICTVHAPYTHVLLYLCHDVEAAPGCPQPYAWQVLKCEDCLACNAMDTGPYHAGGRDACVHLRDQSRWARRIDLHTSTHGESTGLEYGERVWGSTIWAV
jgi:hypothetical protein